MAHRVNVAGTENIMRIAGKRGARVIHLSIDLVFAGRQHGSYVETDPTDPVTVYGAKMVEAERLVSRYMPDACTLRISLPMGISFNGHAGAIDWIASRFKQNKPATLYFDEVRTPKYTDCMNRLFHTLMNRSFRGIYHAGGPRQLSLYQIAQIVNAVGGYEPDLLKGCPRIEAGPLPPRAGNVALDSAKLIDSLGYQPFDPWPYDEELVPSHERWHFESRYGDPCSDRVRELLYRNPNQPGLVPPSRNQLWGGKRFA
jgi:dTDP-4-dehydrorhamnose reductase